MLNAVQNTDSQTTGYGKELFEILMPMSNILVVLLMSYVTIIELSNSIESMWNFIYTYIRAMKQLNTNS